MWIWQAIEIIGRTIWAFAEALFSLFPVYQQLSNLRTEIIAAIFGVPAILIAIAGILIKVLNLALNIHRSLINL